ncbi:MAG: DNA mismatch repair endonuclease MutL [Treponema sp.]|jgi:DNA mismatch repair protein MutL|nr:DNA mismatch repair endonuclease MutL [Treponema sp.]
MNKADGTIDNSVNTIVNDVNTVDNNGVQAGKIRILPPEEARRIAAGEVIDRPAALIREFIDNAIDAGAASIEVSIEDGGSKKAEVIDDGGGMVRNDMELCWLTHATSKIQSLDDLDTAETLGFRGEALAAAAAVARLEIISSVDGREAWRLEAGPGGNSCRIERTRRTSGTTVRALNLFDSIPARKRFLKRAGSEAAVCRQAFIDKALAFPEIAFRFIQDGRLKDMFPAAASKKERFAAALLDTREGVFLHEIHVTGAGFSADVVIGGPEIYRNDKRMLYVFANGRRIQDYSLVQAMEYGTQGWFPNGTHPAGAVYVDIDPALADFNIHPAKREARFRDGGAVHHAVSAGLRDFCRHFSLKAHSESVNAEPPGNAAPDNFLPEGGGEADFRVTHNGGSRDGGWPRAGNPPLNAGAGGGVLALAMEALLENRTAFASLPGHPRSGALSGGMAAETTPFYGEPCYAGRVFGLFILVEWGEKLFIVDQHAAHERILYDRFLAGPVPRQELLVPVPFTTESGDDDRFLEAKREDLARLGVVIERDDGIWRIEALPAGWGSGDAETVKAILALRNAGENMAERWAATVCCHAAVRDGGYLDGESAFALAKEALALPDPHCPHGRPIWTSISREALYKAVRRS